VRSEVLEEAFEATPQQGYDNIFTIKLRMQQNTQEIEISPKYKQFH